jgi:large subunit ribosomal protein L4
MSAKVLTIDEAKAAKFELIENARGGQAVHDTVVALQAARRSGTASVKTKATVNLSGAKPWRQKGTGRARAGYASSPVWVGGGVVFGPHPRDYSKTVPRQVRKLALRKALSARIVAGDVLIVDTFSVAEPKTKQFVNLIKDHAAAEEKVLVIGAAFDENTYKAARNVRPAQLVTAREVNTEQLLAYRKIIVTSDALPQLAERTAK